MSREKVLCGKGEIIQVAVGIVDREGMEAVSIRRIAKELGVSSMTIYNYVENLQDVKKYVLISGFDRMYSRIFEALNASPGVGGSAGVCRAWRWRCSGSLTRTVACSPICTRTGGCFFTRTPR